MQSLRRHASLGMCVLVGLAAGCSGASAIIPGGADGGGSGEGGSGSSSGGGGSDSGGTGHDGATGDSGGPAESGSADSGSPGDTGSSSETGPATCAPLGAGATDVYVDQRYTGPPPTGVQACPFTTITQGLAAVATLSGTRTVHVAGSTPPLAYDEASSLTIAANVILEGDGSAKTSISAGGACGSVTCAVLVDAGGTLGGFTVTSPTGDAIVTQAGNPSPAVRNVVATQAMGYGLLALGGAELGPSFSANGNGSSGLESPQGAAGLLHVIGVANTFDDNKGNGIDVNGGATLAFEGGTANSNFQGIRLAGTGTTGASVAHTITSLTATGNTGPGGFVAYGGQTMKLRSSTLTGNSGVGLYYAYANGGTLDIGTVASPGGNVFGGATASKRNTVGGLRLCGVTVASAQTANGDEWSACAPAQAFLDCSGTGTAPYSDILYGPALSAGGGPVVVTGCAVGP